MQREFIEIRKELQIPVGEISFRTSRSGGPGGQHVNKSETRVELIFHIDSSPSLTPSQRLRIRKKLASQIDSDGVLRIVNQESRSQWKNKQEALNRFQELLREALKPVKKRIRTSRTFTSIERRLRKKKIKGEQKRGRSAIARGTIENE